MCSIAKVFGGFGCDLIDTTFATRFPLLANEKNQFQPIVVLLFDCDESFGIEVCVRNLV